MEWEGCHLLSIPKPQGQQLSQGMQILLLSTTKNQDFSSQWVFIPRSTEAGNHGHCLESLGKGEAL